MPPSAGRMNSEREFERRNFGNTVLRDMLSLVSGVADRRSTSERRRSTPSPKRRVRSARTSTTFRSYANTPIQQPPVSMSSASISSAPRSRTSSTTQSIMPSASR